MRRTLILFLALLVLWGVVTQVNHAVTGWRVYVFVGGLFVVYAALTQPLRPGLATSLLAGLVFDANAPAEIAGTIDIVDCFRKTADIMPIAEDAIAIGAKVLWQQIGVLNHEAGEKARAAGLDSIMDRCVKIEHGRLFGGLNWCGVNTGVISAKRPH